MQLVLSGILTMCTILFGIRALGIVRYEKNKLALKVIFTMICGIGLAMIFRDFSSIFLLVSVLLFLLSEKNAFIPSILSVTICMLIAFTFNLLVYPVFFYISESLLHLQIWDTLARIFADTIILFLTIILCKYIKKIKVRVERTDLYSKLFSYNTLYIVIGCIIFLSVCIVNIIVMRSIDTNNESVILSAIISISYCIIGVITGVVLCNNLKKDIESKSKERELEDLRQYNMSLEHLYNEMRKFRHDYINILSSMAGYIDEEDMRGLKNFFEEKIIPLGSSIDDKNFKIGLLHNIKIKEIKGVVLTKVLHAQELGIEVFIDVVEEIESANMDVIDLCRCIGILIDNALEAAVLCDKPKVKIGFVKRKDTLVIVIINSISKEAPPVFKIFEKGFSTKGEGRGLGLSNIRETLSKYPNASLDTVIEKNEFNQILELS